MTALAQDATLTLGKDDVVDVPVRPAGLRYKLFSIRGRCGVRSYHTRSAAVLAAMVPPGAALVVAAIAADGGGSADAPFVIGMTVFTLGLIAGMASSICITIQRLHDLGRSGWFYLITLVPVINILFALYYCYVPGKPEANAFGEVHEPSTVSRIVGPILIVLGVLCFVGVYGFALFGPGQA